MLKKKRRLLWLARIHRADLKPASFTRGCSSHFVTGIIIHSHISNNNVHIIIISGKPKLLYETDPDWALNNICDSVVPFD